MQPCRILMTSILLVYGCAENHTHAPIKTEPQTCLTFGPLEAAPTQSEINDTLDEYKPDENSLITFCYTGFRVIALPEAVTAYENYDATAEETSCQFWREQFSQHIRSAAIINLDGKF